MHEAPVQDGLLPSGIPPGAADAPLAEVLLAIDGAGATPGAVTGARTVFHRLCRKFAATGLRSEPTHRQPALVAFTLFGKAGFRYRCAPRDEVSTFTHVLGARRGACLGLAAVVCALGEHLGLSAAPLLYDGHVAIGCTAVEPPRHIELSRRGAELTPMQVERFCRLSPEGARHLNRSEFLAVYLSNQAAFVHAARAQWAHALNQLRVATRLFPEYCGAWINLGAVLVALGANREAARALRRAATLEPGPRFRPAIERLNEQLAARRFCSAGEASSEVWSTTHDIEFE